MASNNSYIDALFVEDVSLNMFEFSIYFIPPHKPILLLSAVLFLVLSIHFYSRTDFSLPVVLLLSFIFLLLLLPPLHTYSNLLKT
jgi:hypothetical protein